MIIKKLKIIKNIRNNRLIKKCKTVIKTDFNNKLLWTDYKNINTQNKIKLLYIIDIT